MTNTIAAGIALSVIAVFAADQLWFGWDLPVFLGRKFVDLVEWMAFWR